MLVSHVTCQLYRKNQLVRLCPINIVAGEPDVQQLYCSLPSDPFRLAFFAPTCLVSGIKVSSQSPTVRIASHYLRFYAFHSLSDMIVSLSGNQSDQIVRLVLSIHLLLPPHLPNSILEFRIFVFFDSSNYCSGVQDGFHRVGRNNAGLKSSAPCSDHGSSVSLTY